MSACHAGLLGDNRTPVGSVRFLSARFPASLIRKSRIRPLGRFISTSVPEPNWQQALPLDTESTASVPPFALALTLENLADLARLLQSSRSRLCDGQIVEEWLLTDQLKAMHQLRK